MKIIQLQEENYNVLVDVLKSSLQISNRYLTEWEIEYENINDYKKQAKTKERIIERYEYFTNRVNQLENLIKDLDNSK